MMEILSSLSIGVIAGLVATFFSAVLYKIWLSIITPWFEEIIYKDAKIEGRWEIETEIHGKLRKGILEIRFGVEKSKAVRKVLRKKLAWKDVF